MSNGPNVLFTQPAYFLPFLVALTVSTTVVSFDPSSIPPGASGAFIANRPGAGIVHFAYGTDPSTAVGIPLLASEVMILEDESAMNNFRFIRQSTTDGVVTFQFLAVKNIR